MGDNDPIVTAFEIKAVDSEQRLIDGYAAFFNNEDQGGDLIEPGAFSKALDGRDISKIPVLIGHRQDALPVGMPVAMKQDQNGLFTSTRIHKTSQGDDLLALAKERLAAGAGLGMSISWRPMPGGVSYESGVRHLKQIDVGEYSYVVSPMNVKAGVVAVKKADEEKAGRAISRANHDRMMAHLDSMQGAIDQMRAMVRQGAGMDAGGDMSASTDESIAASKTETKSEPIPGPFDLAITVAKARGGLFA